MISYVNVATMKIDTAMKKLQGIKFSPTNYYLVHLSSMYYSWSLSVCFTNLQVHMKNEELPSDICLFIFSAACGNFFIYNSYVKICHHPSYPLGVPELHA